MILVGNVCTPALLLHLAQFKQRLLLLLLLLLLVMVLRRYHPMMALALIVRRGVLLLVRTAGVEMVERWRPCDVIGANRRANWGMWVSFRNRAESIMAMMLLLLRS